MEISKEAIGQRLHTDMRKRLKSALEAASDINNTDTNFSDEVATIRAALSDAQWLLANLK